MLFKHLKLVVYDVILYLLITVLLESSIFNLLVLKASIFFKDFLILTLNILLKHARLIYSCQHLFILHNDL